MAANTSEQKNSKASTSTEISEASTSAKKSEVSTTKPASGTRAKKQAPSYVFMDIDGTIYNYDHGLVKSVADAVARLKDNGHHPVVCTGRTKVMIFDEIMNLDFDGIIAGAGTYIEWQGKELYRDELSHEQVVRIINIMRRNGFCSYPEGHEYFYYDSDFGAFTPGVSDEVINGAMLIKKIYQKEIPGKVKPIDLTHNMHVSKISAAYTSTSNRDKAIEEIGDEFYWVDHYDILFETILKSSSKGMAIRHLMNYLGEDLENTYAFGDSFNDLDMLQTVKYGFCMGNAKDSLKEIVPLHAGPMLEDGVYNTLVKYGLI